MNKKPIDQRKVCLLLSELAAEMRVEFIGYLKSPICNAQAKAAMVELIEKLIIDSGAKEVSAESFYKQLYPERRFNAQSLHTQLGQLLDLLYEFFAIKELQRDRIAQSGLAARFFRNHLETEQPEKTIQAFMKRIEKTKVVDGKAFLAKHETLNEFDYLLQKNSAVLTLNHLNTQNLWLDYYYTLRKVEIGIGAKGIQVNQELDFEVSNLEQCLDFIAKNLKNLPLIFSAVYHSYQLDYSDPESVHYEALKRILIAREIDFLPEKKKAIFFVLLNYCTYQINKGHLHFQKEWGALLEIALRSDLLLERGLIPANRLRSIVIFLCRAEAHETAQKLLEKFKDKVLNDPEGQEAKRIVAIHKFYLRDYNTCLELLSGIGKTKFSSWRAEMSYRLYELKARIERGDDADFDLLDKRFDSLYKLIHRNSDMSETQGRYKNFYSLAKQYFNLSKYPLIEVRPQLQSLYEEVRAATDLSNKVWLLQVISTKLSEKKGEEN